MTLTMSDDIDIANDEMEKRIEASIKSANTTPAPKNHTNKCLWCREPIVEKDKRRWCDAHCRDAHTATYKL
jgi:hypothetical protein